MAYEPTNWQAGDIVTSAKLNKMEQGINNNVMIIECEFIGDSYDSKMLVTMTGDEIWEAYKNGTRILFHCPETAYNGENLIELLAMSKVPSNSGGSPYITKTTTIENIGALSYDQNLNTFYFDIYVD